MIISMSNKIGLKRLATDSGQQNRKFAFSKYFTLSRGGFRKSWKYYCTMRSQMSSALICAIVRLSTISAYKKTYTPKTL